MQRAVVQQQLLSYYCSQGKKIIKNGKLNLFGKGIKIIDILKLDKQILESITELDLSHNSIYSLENISQFVNLQILTISHNEISQASELTHLTSLKRLAKISMKKNPFLNCKISINQRQLLSSFCTDIHCLSQDIQRKIDEAIKKKVQLECFSNYQNKVQMHVQLNNKIQREVDLENPGVSMFPKIKKIFEIYSKQISLRRWYVEKMKKELFYDQKSLLDFLDKQIEKMKETRSSKIRKIYEFQDILKQERVKSTQSKLLKSNQQMMIHDKFQSKIIVGNKMNNVIFNLKKNNEVKQNSPLKVTIEPRNFKDELSLQQNFLNTLVKVNPVYHLLHSPISSLKSHEKDLLIKSLLSFSKEKMKQIGKYQQSEKDHLTLKNDFISLQQHLEWITEEVKKQQEIHKEKYSQLETECQEQGTKLDEMVSQLEKYKEKLRQVNIENENLRSNLKSQESFRKQIEDQEDRCELIQQNREKRLVNKYLKLLNQKAIKRYKLNTLNSINKKVEERNIQFIIFNEFRTYAIQNKLEKRLKQQIIKKRSFQCFSIMKLDLKQSENQKQCQKIIKSRSLGNLRNNCCFCIKQKSSIAQKKYQLLSIIKQKFKNKILMLFKKLKKKISKNEVNSVITQTRNHLSMTKFFRFWTRYVTQTVNENQSNIKKIKHNLKAHQLSFFTKRCRNQVNFLVNVYALESFLQKYRKITAYLNFNKTVSSVLFSRQIKTMKIKKLKQYKYFEYFVEKMRDNRVKKKIKNQIYVKQQEQKRQEALRIRQKEQCRRHKLKIKFRYTLLKINSSIISKVLIRQSKIIHLRKKIQKKKTLLFFSNLQSYSLMKTKISLKLQLLKKSMVFSRPIKLFFTNLSVHQNNLVNHNKVQKSKTYSIYFYRWKAFTFWQRMQTYKTKFESLEPQITKISVLQGEMKEEKSLLLQQLKDKELMIQEYIKKCQEYEFTLHSKSLKYEKLKQIYAQSVQLRDLNHTIKICDSAANFSNRNFEKNEDIYKKYLPRKGINGIEEFNMMRTPIHQFLEPEKEGRRDETLEKQEFLKDPFIQTFRKF